MKKSILTICLFSILFLPYFAFAQNYPITWSTKKIDQTIGLGGTTNASVSFSSKINLSNVDIFIASKIKPFLILSQTHFDVITQNTNYSLGVNISVPYGTQTGLYDGTIHLKAKSKTYSLPLAIKINVADGAANIGPTGGVVQVTDPGSPFYGVQIQVPSGALSESITISIQKPSINSPLPNGWGGGENPIELQPSGSSFAYPVKLIIPSGGLSERNFYVYDDVEQVWHFLRTLLRNSFFEININHFSTINWLCRYSPLLGCATFEPCSTVTYRIDPDTHNAPGYTPDEIKISIRKAIKKWETALSGVLKFQEVEDLNPDITFFWSSIGFIYFSDLLTGTENLGFHDVDILGNKLIKFNDTGNVKWSANVNDYNPEASIEAIALHEIGHALGLPHYCDQCFECIEGGPVMADNTDVRWPPCVDLKISDIERIRQLYDIKVVTLTLDGLGLDVDQDGIWDVELDSTDAMGNEFPVPLLATRGETFCGGHVIGNGNRLIPVEGFANFLGIEKPEYCSITIAPNFVSVPELYCIYCTEAPYNIGDTYIFRSSNGDKYVKLFITETAPTWIRFSWSEIGKPDCETCVFGLEGLNYCSLGWQ